MYVAIHIGGCYAQLASRGKIDSSETKSGLKRLANYPDDKTRKKSHLLFDDLDKYFLLPDGQLIRGTEPNESTLMRNYYTIPGIKSIGQRKISCIMCQSPTCDGKPNSNCIERIKVFEYHGLSKSGGFKNQPLKIEQSI